MNLKNILNSLISRKPKQASLPLKPPHPINPPNLVWENPPEAKETPRKRVPYIPTSESPWAVIAFRRGKWVFEEAQFTRWNARQSAKLLRTAGRQARVVRLIVPTR